MGGTPTCLDGGGGGARGRQRPRQPAVMVATVDAAGVVGGAAVGVACAGGGWQPVMAVAASAACGNTDKCVWHAQAADGSR